MLCFLRAVVRETSPPVAQQTLASPAVSTEPSKASRGKKANSKTTNKKMKSPISTSLPQQSNKQAAPPAWISSPLTSLSTPTAKRSTTPSPTMSQRSQSPPPAPPSPAPPPLKVITTKEETRVFKLKPKKTKASKTVSNSSGEEVKPKKEVATQQSQGKRARSSSVSSNDRNKNSAPAQKTSKPNAENTPIPPSPPSPKETTSAESKTTIWQSRPDNKTLPKTTTATTATNRPQPPVGKILPEVRKPLSTGLESTNTVLPKPIGYRQHAPLEKKPSPCWNNTNASSSWFGLPSLPSAGAWYPENGSLFSRPIQQHQQSTQEPSRDWFGLRSLASELTAPNSGASSANMDHSTWPVNSTPYPVDPPSTGTGNLWPEIQPTSSGNPVNSAVGSRVYSPWSVPHWLNVTQRQPERQEPGTGQADQLGVLASGIWDSPSPRSPNNNNQDSWNSDYSQF